LLTERHVLRVAPDGDVQPLSESARRVRLTGDGGLLLLREDSTGLFEAR
jgi:hypothetical protein